MVYSTGPEEWPLAHASGPGGASHGPRADATGAAVAAGGAATGDPVGPIATANPLPGLNC